MTTPPRIFMSYSHDDQAHKNWVLNLASRLVANGVDVVLDQWNLSLGGDLPRFMETGLTNAYRVVTICSADYVTKADAGQGGTGYEKMILTGQLMQDLTNDRIIPIIRNNSSQKVLPTFLSSRIYIDFRDDLAFERRYTELLHDIHGEAIQPRPALGPNPFTQAVIAIDPRISFSPERYVSPSMSGIVTFDYSNNDGKYVVGAGDFLFETAWSRRGSSSIYAYNDPPSIRAVAIAEGKSSIDEIIDASVYDTSSRVRSPFINEIVIWKNTAGYYLATRIEKLQCRDDNSLTDEITFSYQIAPLKSADFSSAGALA